MLIAIVSPASTVRHVLIQVVPIPVSVRTDGLGLTVKQQLTNVTPQYVPIPGRVQTSLTTIFAREFGFKQRKEA